MDAESLILKALKESQKPLSTREISMQLNMAWHTIDRYCLKLQIKKKVDSFTIGKSTAWFMKK